MWESAACCMTAFCSVWPMLPWGHLCTAVSESSKLELIVMRSTLQRRLGGKSSISAWATLPVSSQAFHCINDYLL